MRRLIFDIYRNAHRYDPPHPLPIDADRNGKATAFATLHELVATHAHAFRWFPNQPAKPQAPFSPRKAGNFPTSGAAIAEKGASGLQESKHCKTFSNLNDFFAGFNMKP